MDHSRALQRSVVGWTVREEAWGWTRYAVGASYEQLLGSNLHLEHAINTLHARAEAANAMAIDAILSRELLQDSVG